jgi:hypothetical protein
MSRLYVLDRAAKEHAALMLRVALLNGHHKDKSLKISKGQQVVLSRLLHQVLPYVLGGGGALVFDPTNNPGGTFVGATQDTRGAFPYGAGADYVFTKHLLLRAEYRGFVY